MKIPIKYKRVSELYCVPIARGKTFGESFQKVVQETGTKVYNYKYPLNKFRVVPGKVNYLIITVDSVRKHDPGQAYTFFWSGDVSDEVVDVFDSYRDSVKTLRSDAKVAPGYRRIADSYELLFGNPMGFVKSDIKANSGNGNKPYGNSLAGWYTVRLPKRPKTVEELYDAIDAAESTYSGSALPTITVPQSRDTVAALNRAYTSLIRLVVQRSDRFDTQWKTAYLSDLRKAEFRLLRIAALMPADYSELIKGTKNLDCLVCKGAAPNQYESRQTNLKATSAAFDELYTLAASLSIGQPELKPATRQLRRYATDFQNALVRIKPLLQARSDLKDQIFVVGVSNLSLVNGDSHLYSFETRSKASITPDFGIAIPVAGKINPYPLLPYLGFHVNLRPLNRDVPYKSYVHKGLNRYSLMVGWSLVNIDNGPKRTARSAQDSIASFFNNKGTLLLGGGYRLGNAARLTFGGVCYFKYQLANPAVPLVYNDRSLRVWPFVGVAVDLALKDLLNGISDVFPAASRRFVPPPPPTP